MRTNTKSAVFGKLTDRFGLGVVLGAVQLHEGLPHFDDFAFL